MLNQTLKENALVNKVITNQIISVLYARLKDVMLVLLLLLAQIVQQSDISILYLKIKIHVYVRITIIQMMMENNVLAVDKN
jgi:hypothetical protein